MIDTDDERLLARLRGDPRSARRAIDELYRRYKPGMMGYFIRRGMAQDQAQDLVQETFCRAMTKLDSFRGESRLITWVWGFSDNLLLEKRNPRMGDQVLPAHADDDPDEAVAEGGASAQAWINSHWPQLDDVICFSEALQKFSLKYPERFQVLLFHAEGWTNDEIGEFLGRSEGATRQYLYECRQKLRPYLAPCMDCVAVASGRRKKGVPDV